MQPQVNTSHWKYTDRATQDVRFWAKVDKAGDCWLWTEHFNDDGYGRWKLYEGRRVVASSAHRIAWILVNGPIPDGMEVCHSCDNRPCCRAETDPERSHLFLGTHLANMADRESKQRAARGEQAGLAKLTDLAVLEIRRRYDAGEPIRAVAARFGVATATIIAIGHRDTWRHLPEAVPGAAPTTWTGRREALVLEVRRRRGAGESAISIAADLGVSKQLVQRIWGGKTWKHIP